MQAQVYHIKLEDAYLYTIDNFLSPEEATNLFNQSESLSLVHRPKVRTGYANRDVGFYSKTVPYYKFSGQKYRTMGCPDFIWQLLEKVNKHFEKELLAYKFKLNADLINRYTDGSDYISLHSDNEKQLQQELILAISTFKVVDGTRKFRIRRIDGEKIEGKNFKDIISCHGQLLVMGGNFQKIFTHEVPVEKSNKKAHRISHTIRCHSEDERDYD
jgi:alkylated DNA repair dioxygenase AlkB